MWDNDHRDLYTYDSDNNQLSRNQRQDWVGGAWDDDYRDLYTYDGLTETNFQSY